MSGNSGIRPPAASETVFVADDDPDFGKLDTPQEITESARVVTVYLKTTRYVGEVDALGFLEYGDADVKAGRLAGKMRLTIRARISGEGVVLGPGGVQVEVFLHRGMAGRERSLGTLDGAVLSQWQDTIGVVNTVDVRFPDDPCPSQDPTKPCGKTPEPRPNEISFVFSGTAQLTMEVDWLTLEPAPDYPQGLACRPVLLLHGWKADASQMERVWGPGLRSRDMPCHAVDLEPRGTFQNNGQLVAAAVSDLKNRFGVEKVNILGFSKGGIDARDSIQRSHDVETLVMLASPNAGSFLMDLASGTFLDFCQQMTTGYMAHYNSMYTVNKKMFYDIGAAYYDSWWAQAASWQYGPNDEVVTVSSVEAAWIADDPSRVPAPFEFPTSTTDSESQGICAQQKLANHQCLINNLIIFGWLVGSFAYVRDPQDANRRLAGTPAASRRGISAAAGAGSAAGEDRLEGVSSETASVPSEGVIQRHTAFVDAADRALFYAFADGDVLSLALVSPGGTRIEPSMSSSDGAVVHAPLQDSEFCWYTAYQIQQPETGTWTLEVTGTSAPSPDSQYGVSAFAQLPAGRGVSMTAAVDRDAYVAGDVITITATVTSDGLPVTDAAVTAQVRLTEGGATASTLQLDSTAGDGTYRGSFAGTTVPGSYQIVVSAEGAAPAFTRQQALQISVAPSAAAFSGTFSDRGSDADGDGRYDELVVDVGVDVDVAAEYRVFGTLTDGSGATIEQVAVAEQLQPGSQTVSLPFDGARLFDLRLDGPYVLDDLVIEDAATLTGLARGPAYTTAAYSHDAFERPVCILTGNATDHGVNSDAGDQLPYEELVVEVEVDSLVAADVQAVAQLYAEDGTFVATELTFSSLTAGSNMLGFHFPAPAIYRAGRAGPYDLRLFSMWEVSAEETSVSLRAPDVVAVTQPYALEDFGESPTFTVGGTVTGLEGEGLELTDYVSFLRVHPGNGPFTFSQPRPSGSAYDVRITVPPTNPVQLCSIVNARGTVGTANVDDIAVECVTPPPGAELDTSFGSAGQVTADQAPAAALALQSDGRIVVVGGLGLARFDPDGGADSSFGDAGGAVSVEFGSSSYAAAQSLAIQPDGKIVVAGYTTSDPQGAHYDFALARYTAEGALDPAFHGGTVLTTDFAGGYDTASTVLLQADGKIVVAGGASSGGVLGQTEFGVARYTADGALDSAFGTGGTVMTPLAGGSGSATAAVLQPDGKIVVSGPSYRAEGESFGFGLVRYTVDGALDPDFGDAGIVSADFGLPLYPAGLALQDDGKLVVAGWAFGSPEAFAVARFDAAGQPDPGFGGAGLVTTPFATPYARGQAAAIQADGKIVVAGYTQDASSEDFAIARYEIDGGLDPSFGDGGKVILDSFDDWNRATCLAIQADGRIVVGGSALRGSRLCLVRLWPQE